MKKTRLLALAAALCAGVAVPASAQPQPGYGPAYGARFDRIGTVDFSFRPEHETAYGNFGGRVERLAFRARNGNVMCRQVTATFGNGRTRQLYRGVLQTGRDVIVDLPGQARMIRRIDFDCRSTRPRIARVDIAADIGQYRAEWRRSPDWATVWSRTFNWGNEPYADNRYGGDRYVTEPLNTAGWITVGTEVFDGYSDRETAVTGFAGRDVDRLAVRPVNNDARCSEITATFANGMTRRLNIDDRQLLQEDRVYELDLPGGRRDVMRVDMVCHPENGRQVAMQVMASR